MVVWSHFAFLEFTGVFRNIALAQILGYLFPLLPLPTRTQLGYSCVRSFLEEKNARKKRETDKYMDGIAFFEKDTTTHLTSVKNAIKRMND